MKKHIQKVLAVGLFSLFLSTSASATDYLTVTTDNANVRTGAGLDYPSSMELFTGYPLKILKKDGEWYQIVDFEKDTGWIHQSIVKKRDTVIVNAASSVNMRSEPSTESSIVADVERGVVMTVLATKGKWTQVRHSSGTSGWIYNPLLWP